MKVSFQGIGESVVTFYSNKTYGAGAGVPVKMSGNGEVCCCAEGDAFFGVSIASDGEFAAIQTSGYVELDYTGQDPAVGFLKLSANGLGGVKAAENGREHLVIEVDTQNKKISFML